MRHMAHHTLSVPEISCNHCKAAIEDAVGALSGVSSVSVDVPAKTVTIDGDAPLATITEAIVDAGYDVAGTA